MATPRIAQPRPCRPGYRSRIPWSSVEGHPDRYRELPAVECPSRNDSATFVIPAPRSIASTSTPTVPFASRRRSAIVPRCACLTMFVPSLGDGNRQLPRRGRAEIESLRQRGSAAPRLRHAARSLMLTTNAAGVISIALSSLACPHPAASRFEFVGQPPGATQPQSETVSRRKAVLQGLLDIGYAGPPVGERSV
jgi:hypothetical protein